MEAWRREALRRQAEEEHRDAHGLPPKAPPKKPQRKKRFVRAPKINKVKQRAGKKGNLKRWLNTLAWLTDLLKLRGGTFGNHYKVNLFGVRLLWVLLLRTGERWRWEARELSPEAEAELMALADACDCGLSLHRIKILCTMQPYKFENGMVRPEPKPFFQAHFTMEWLRWVLDVKPEEKKAMRQAREKARRPSAKDRRSLAIMEAVRVLKRRSPRIRPSIRLVQATVLKRTGLEVAYETVRRRMLLVK